MDIEIKEQGVRSYVGIRQMVPVEKIAEIVGPLFEKVYAYVGQAGGHINGGALSIYYNEPSIEFDMECAVPVANELSGEGDIKPGSLPEGKVAIATHKGSYDGLKNSWEEFGKTAFKRGLEFKMPCWEEYLTDPSVESDPSMWVTLLVCPIK